VSVSSATANLPMFSVFRIAFMNTTFCQSIRINSFSRSSRTCGESG
jgi:hypothetical protein